MFEMGMMVEFVKGNLSGVKGEITSIFRNVNGFEYTIKPKNANNTYLVSDETFLKQIPKFAIGECVRLVGNKSLFNRSVQGCIATIYDVNYLNLNRFEYQIFVNGTRQWVQNENESDMQVYNPSVNGVLGLATPTYIFGQGATNSTIITEPTTCNHKWKFYMGLVQKYEYCENCNEKRDTDRWS